MSYGEISALASIIASIAGAGVAWGVTKGTINGLRARVATLESNKYITREEYADRHKELVDMVKELLRK